MPGIMLRALVVPPNWCMAAYGLLVKMLALAKVEQLRQQGDLPVTRLDAVLREVERE